MYSSHVLCYRKGRGRKLCHFKVLPPGTRNCYVHFAAQNEQLFRFYLLSDVGEYLLKVYAKPEAEVFGNDDRLDHVATIPIHCIQVVERHMPKISQMFLKPVLQVCVLMLFFAFQVKNRPLPYPRSDNAWGVTQAFFDTGIVLAR